MSGSTLEISSSPRSLVLDKFKRAGDNSTTTGQRPSVDLTIPKVRQLGKNPALSAAFRELIETDEVFLTSSDKFHLRSDRELVHFKRIETDQQNLIEKYVAEVNSESKCINYAELACLPSVNASFLSRSLNTLVSIGRIVIVDTIFLDQPTTYRSKHRLGPNLDSVIGNCSIAPGGIADGTLVRYAIIRWVEQQTLRKNLPSRSEVFRQLLSERLAPKRYLQSLFHDIVSNLVTTRKLESHRRIISSHRIPQDGILVDFDTPADDLATAYSSRDIMDTFEYIPPDSDLDDDVVYSLVE